MKNWLLVVVLAAVSFVSCQSGKEEEQKPEVAVESKRIVSLNGSVTELIYALGAEQELVGVDVTSTFPDETKYLTNLGHVRKLAVESLLALTPTHILMLEDEVSPDLKDKLEKAGITLKTFPHPNDVQGAKNLVKEVADWIGKPEAAKAVIGKIDADLKKTVPLEKKPKVLFVYARGAGTLMVAGEGTPLEKMIGLAGGENAGTGFTDFKPLTSESVIAANPDVILMFTSGAQSLGPDGVFKVPGIAATNAGKKHALIQMDGQLLSGFGPRVGEAVFELNQQLNKLN